MGKEKLDKIKNNFEVVFIYLIIILLINFSRFKKNNKIYKKEEMKKRNVFGILIEIHNTLDIDRLLYCNNNYLKGENIFYYFYCSNKISKEIYEVLSCNQINNFEIFFYKDKENDLKKIITFFGNSIINRSDYFLHFNKIENINKENIIGNNYFKSTEIMKFINSNENYIKPQNTTFYTMIYKIKSKFDFNKYIEWGKNLINFIDQELVIFTNKDTYEILKPLFLNKKNIKVIFKEFDDFKFIKYQRYLKENTDKLYFPDHKIDYKLILIWLERHIILDEINSKKSNICYIDWGYFREKVKAKLNFNLISYPDLYLSSVNNKSKNICEAISLLIKEDPNIEKYILNCEPIIGGGGFIIKTEYIKEYKKYFLNIFDKLYDNKINFKDDQTILSILYLRKNYGNINLIRMTGVTRMGDEWFPLKNVLSGSNKYELLDRI